MKTKLTKILLGAARLFASANSGWALLPRKHVVRGVIEKYRADHTHTDHHASGGWQAAGVVLKRLHASAGGEAETVAQRSVLCADQLTT